MIAKRIHGLIAGTVLVIAAVFATAASAQVASQPGWDPAITWQGCYDSDAIYFSFTSNPYTSACESQDFFYKSSMYCEAAAPLLEAIGQWQGSLLEWRERVPYPNSRNRWQELRDRDPDRPVECQDDRGIHGDVPGVWYAADGFAGPWDTTSLNEPAWLHHYYLYDGNFLNWLNAYVVAIDVLPGDAANQVYPNGTGKLPVAILSSAEFDATQVDPATLRFGPAETGISEAVTIVNADSLFGDDTVARFRVEDSGIACNDTDVTLWGSTYAGDEFTGGSMIDASDCEDEGCHAY